MDIIHTCLEVRDADELTEWYVNELGFSRSWEFTSPDGTSRNVYITDDSGIELQISDTKGEQPEELGDAWDHIAIEVKNVDQVFSQVDHHGVVQKPTTYDAIDARVAFIRDPEGRIIELVEFTS